MSNTAVSVIVPCYCQACFLADALASVQAQTFPDWECIIVNDGSPDDTAAVARHWMKRDGRFRYVEKVNGGLSNARNAGLRAARGQFIQFLDADDVIKPDKFSRQLNSLGVDASLALACCDYYRAPSNNLNCEIPGACLSPQLKPNQPLLQVVLDWETRLSIPIHCYLLDARFFKVHGVSFDETLPNHEDWDFLIQMLLLQPRVVYLNAKLAVYRQHEASMCYNRGVMRRGFLRAIQKEQRRLKASPQLLAALQTKRREVLKIYADCSPFRRVFYRPTRRILKALLPQPLIRRLRSLKRRHEA